MRTLCVTLNLISLPSFKSKFASSGQSFNAAVPFAVSAFINSYIGSITLKEGCMRVFRSGAVFELHNCGFSEYKLSKQLMHAGSEAHWR